VRFGPGGALGVELALLPGGGRALEEDEEALVLFPSTTEELDMVRPDPLPWSLLLLLFFFATCA